MTTINENECEAAGLDAGEIKRIALGLSRYGKQAQALGRVVFGGSGSGSLRFEDQGQGDLVVAELDGSFSGGDGACGEDEDGLIRGEF